MSRSAPVLNAPLVLVEKVESITVITINRPEVRNCVNRPTADALVLAFKNFEQDETSPIAVLCGSAGNFCAGADLKAVASGDADLVNKTELEGDGPMGPSRMMLSKPVVAAIEGYAVAGGLELALWADLRVVAEDAIMGVFCRRWGVPLIDGGTVRLPRIIGMGRALDLVLTGRPVGAHEAKEIGLANKVVPKGSAKSEAIHLALTIASFPQKCMLADRRSTYEQHGLPLADAIRNEFQLGSQVLLESISGATRFASGSGRGGHFDAVARPTSSL